MKGNEEYTQECGALIARTGVDFFLVEPALVLTEVANAIGRNIDLEAAQEGVDSLLRMITILVSCDREFCLKAGLTGAQYDIYSADSVYLQAAINHGSVLVSLDEKDFVSKVTSKKPLIEAYHIRDLPY